MPSDTSFKTTATNQLASMPAANSVGFRPSRFSLILCACLALYVVAALTPSSYALALNLLGVTPQTVSIGAPREIRSDEWAVWTPYMQAIVRNRFQRYNATSVYHEDLRNVNPLPILDWGLLFKPYFWPFFAVPPAFAYSFFYAFQLFCFLYGYRQLFRRFHLPDDLAAAGSLLLFFCGFTQYWWTTLGPTLSFFPWVVLAFVRRPRWWKYPLLAYSIVVWFFGLAYPPATIALCFVIVCLLCSFPELAPKGRIPWLATGGAVIAAGCLIGLYYHDLLRVTMQTVYPGSRRCPSGTESVRLIAAMFWPSFNQQRYEALGPANICESAVVGTFLPLAVLAFADYRRLRALIRDGLQALPRRRVAILLGGILLIAAWMVLPVPALIGKLFLWQFVPARRLLFAVGFLATLLCLLLLHAGGVIVSARRISLVSAAALLGILLSKYYWGLKLTDTHLEEFSIVVFLIATAWLIRQRKAPPRQGVVYACVLANIALFGFFNPFLSAHEIFRPHESPTLKTLRVMEKAEPRGWLITGGYPGAILNGAGFRSLQHVLISPHVKFFRSWFPEMPEAELNGLFNRYAHIIVSDAEAPHLRGFDVVAVPKARFRTAAATSQGGLGKLK